MRTEITMFVVAGTLAASGAGAWALSDSAAENAQLAPVAVSAATDCVTPTFPPGPRPVYPVNANGQTYGADPTGNPDLLAAWGQDADGQWIQGYIVRCTVAAFDYHGHDLPLYASDGETVIGTHRGYRGGSDAPAVPEKMPG